MIIYVMLTVLSFLEFVPYQLLLKSCVSFFFASEVQIYKFCQIGAKLVKYFVIFKS